MLARVQSFLLRGIDAERCEVEVDVDEANVSNRTVVGLPDGAVREALERVDSALSNTGYAFPRGRVLLNLAPADVRKEGPHYDLAFALGLLASQGIVPPALGADAWVDLSSCLIAGELALDGRVRPVRGVIAMAALAKQMGVRAVIVPRENAEEAAIVGEVCVFAVGTLAEAVGLLTGQLEREPHPPVDVAGLIREASPELDFAEVRGQEAVKRAIVIAAAGAHNLLMLGPPGTGKTMMARALPGVLPPLTPEEAIEVTRIYSAAGMLASGSGLVRVRPVRSPHHTASGAAVVGGGVVPRPGEISLAHRGVLFLDELPEFPRTVLETLRQPLEDHVVTISRSHSTVRFPASFMLVAAMNPTPKGDMASDDVSKRAMDRYLSRISGPLIDRIDLHCEVPGVPWKELSAKKANGTSSAQMREAALAARERAMARPAQRVPNARLSGRDLNELAPMEPAALDLLGRAINELGLSARAYDKLRRVSRTIADIADKEVIGPDHVAEAIQYRLLDRAG